MDNLTEAIRDSVGFDYEAQYDHDEYMKAALYLIYDKLVEIKEKPSANETVTITEDELIDGLTISGELRLQAAHLLVEYRKKLKEYRDHIGTSENYRPDLGISTIERMADDIGRETEREKDSAMSEIGSSTNIPDGFTTE